MNQIQELGELKKFEEDRTTDDNICLKHRKQVTNFCLELSCMIPLCPECVSQHSLEHQQKKQFIQLDSIENLKTNCMNDLQEMRRIYQSTLNENNHIKSRILNMRSEVLADINRQEQEVYKMANEYFNMLKRQLESQGESIQSELMDKILLSEKKIMQRLNELQKIIGKFERSKKVYKYIGMMHKTEYCIEINNYNEHITNYQGQIKQNYPKITSELNNMKFQQFMHGHINFDLKFQENSVQNQMLQSSNQIHNMMMSGQSQNPMANRNNMHMSVSQQNMNQHIMNQNNKPNMNEYQQNHAMHNNQPQNGSIMEQINQQKNINQRLEYQLTQQNNEKKYSFQKQMMDDNRTNKSPIQLQSFKEIDRMFGNENNSVNRVNNFNCPSPSQSYLNRVNQNNEVRATSPFRNSFNRPNVNMITNSPNLKNLSSSPNLNSKDANVFRQDNTNNNSYRQDNSNVFRQDNSNSYRQNNSRNKYDIDVGNISGNQQTIQKMDQQNNMTGQMNERSISPNSVSRQPFKYNFNYSRPF